MCCASCGVARRSHCNTSIGRALAYEHDALHGGTIGFQQISPAVSPLEFRFRADLCAGESVTRQQAGRFRRAKKSRWHAAASLGVALISNFMCRGSKGVRVREVGVQIGNPN
jgi:hypothetical protein